jgi:acyl carrier protein
MQREQILLAINKIFIDELDNPGITLLENTTAKEVKEWDSLTHIQLVNAMEKHFKIRFSTAEIMNWKNIGDCCTSVEEKLTTYPAH